MAISTTIGQPVLAGRRSLPRRLVREARKSMIGGASLVVLTVLVLAALAAPLIASDPTEQTRGSELKSPTSAHLAGTDEFGRDIFSRVIYGLRPSFIASGVGVGIGILIGATVGLLAGYTEGFLSAAVMRLNDALLAIPGLLFALVVVAMLGASLNSLIIAIAVFNVPVFVRQARAGVLAERHRDYVLAERALGAPDWRILFRHILPNAVPALVVQAAIGMAFSILTEAGLSFLGLGLRPPEPALGLMLDNSRPFMRVAPWYPVFPGIALTAMILGFIGIADIVNRVLDPRSWSFQPSSRARTVVKSTT